MCFPQETAYVRVNSFLHVGALQAIHMHNHVQGGAHVHVANQYLGVVDFSEHAIVETELRFNKKLQEANIDQSKGEGKLRASPRWQERSKCDDICIHDRLSILMKSTKTTVMSADTRRSTLASIIKLAALQG